MSAALSEVAEDLAGHYAATVARLVAIWSETLHMADISPASNFFDLGGDSLLALALFLAIERETGISFPITTVYDAPTVGEMAELILAGGRPRFSPLILMKPGGSGPPLFLVHGIGGTVVELSVLARHIAVASPVYALQAQGIDGTGEPLRSVEDMAELYLDCIRDRQPAGPYMICGYSFGGLVALEIARRLQRLRQEISLLMLMDAFAHPATWPLLSRAHMRIRRANYLFREAARQPWQNGLPMMQAGASRVLRRLFRSNDPQLRLREWLLDRNPDLPLALLKVREAGSAALADYVPRFYSGKVTFLKAAERDPEFPLDPVPIWRGLVREMDVFVVPGGHRTIVTQHAEAVGAMLTACVARARQHEATGRRKTDVRLEHGRRQTRLEPQAIQA
ncbi:MAG: alpha/beta fold hydrolase [Rhizomicrobium sp.]